LEKAVVEPRHIEVQILADGEGDVIHLFERPWPTSRGWTPGSGWPTSPARWRWRRAASGCCGRDRSSWWTT
ncbi:hypothetical protein, partial [Streptomyces sp. NPDC007070]|uniref:ATP-binding protein n=1 Tax=Streptomyces sp. NPDC007070 TaxID=3154312 RepID=UPI0033FFC49A